MTTELTDDELAVLRKGAEQSNGINKQANTTNSDKSLW